MQRFIYLLSFIFYLAFSPFVCAKEKCDKFVVITPEKTGTHLLTKALSLLTGKKTINNWSHSLSKQQLTAALEKAKQEQSFLHIHAYPEPQIVNTLKQKGYKVIFLYRDPRDQAVSLLFFILKGWEYGPLNIQRPFGQLAFDDQLMEIITGERYGLSGTAGIMEKRLPWFLQKKSFVYTAKFENLVGEKGGGTQKAQYRELKNICKHIHLKVKRTDIEKQAAQLFGKPGEATFRSGQIGEWKKYFKPQHTAAFKQRFSPLLKITGYEKKTEW